MSGAGTRQVARGAMIQQVAYVSSTRRIQVVEGDR